jgi:hypothetical protein
MEDERVETILTCEELVVKVTGADLDSLNKESINNWNEGFVDFGHAAMGGGWRGERVVRNVG